MRAQGRRVEQLVGIDVYTIGGDFETSPTRPRARLSPATRATTPGVFAIGFPHSCAPPRKERAIHMAEHTGHRWSGQWLRGTRNRVCGSFFDLTVCIFRRVVTRFMIGQPEGNYHEDYCVEAIHLRAEDPLIELFDAPTTTAFGGSYRLRAD